jgi:hypothetical protein
MTTPQPPRGPVSAEFTERMGAVREAFAKIRDNHLAWILNAATAHFAKEVEDTEAEIVRYERLPDAPIYTTYGRAREGGAPRTRAGAAAPARGARGVSRDPRVPRGAAGRRGREERRDSRRRPARQRLLRAASAAAAAGHRALTALLDPPRGTLPSAEICEVG